MKVVAPEDIKRGMYLFYIDPPTRRYGDGEVSKPLYLRTAIYKVVSVDLPLIAVEDINRADPYESSLLNVSEGGKLGIPSDEMVKSVLTSVKRRGEHMKKILGRA